MLFSLGFFEQITAGGILAPDLNTPSLFANKFTNGNASPYLHDGVEKSATLN